MDTRKGIEHRVTNADLEAAPDLAVEGVREGDLIEIRQDDGVPIYTLRADSMFGIRCLIAIRDLAVQMGVSHKAEIATMLRQFDLYEEQNRPLPAV